MALLSNLRYLVFFIIASCCLAGCTVQRAPLTAQEMARFGISGCPTDMAEECAAIAGKTFLSHGPTQVEYHSPDGRTFLWVGNRVVQGHWSVSKWAGLCYYYEETGSNCLGYTSKDDGPGSTWPGDPFKLSERSLAPANLDALKWGASAGADVERLYASSQTAAQ